MMPSFFGSLGGKALGQIIAGVVVAGGVATGASAAVGGPNIPAAVLQTVSAHQNVDAGQNHARTETTATATGTATGTAKAENADDSLVGLCSAWGKGSDNGQQHKHESAGFAKLIKAAGGNVAEPNSTDTATKVTAYCATLAPAATPTSTATTGANASTNADDHGKKSNDAASDSQSGDHGRPQSPGRSGNALGTATATATATP